MSQIAEDFKKCLRPFVFWKIREMLFFFLFLSLRKITVYSWFIFWYFCSVGISLIYTFFLLNFVFNEGDFRLVMFLIPLRFLSFLFCQFFYVFSEIDSFSEQSPELFKSMEEIKGFYSFLDAHKDHEKKSSNIRLLLLLVQFLLYSYILYF